MTLPVVTRHKDVPRKAWIELALRHCQMSQPDAEGVIDAMLDRRADADMMINRSALPDPQMKQRYRWLLGKRSRALRL